MKLEKPSFFAVFIVLVLFAGAVAVSAYALVERDEDLYIVSGIAVGVTAAALAGWMSR